MAKKVKHSIANTWNYRVLAIPADEIQTDKTPWLEIHEVHYTNGRPNGYGIPAAGVSGDSISDIKLALKNMLACIEKPILWSGQDFPKEYLQK